MRDRSGVVSEWCRGWSRVDLGVVSYRVGAGPSTAPSRGMASSGPVCRAVPPAAFAEAVRLRPHGGMGALARQAAPSSAADGHCGRAHAAEAVSGRHRQLRSGSPEPPWRHPSASPNACSVAHTTTSRAIVAPIWVEIDLGSMLDRFREDVGSVCCCWGRLGQDLVSIDASPLAVSEWTWT